MALLRLLAFSYLAAAAVFAMAATLVAHLQFVDGLARGRRVLEQMADKNLVPFLIRQESEPIARLNLELGGPIRDRRAIPVRPIAVARMVAAPRFREVGQLDRGAIAIMPDLPADTKAARNGHAAGSAFRIPDPPPLDAPVLSRSDLVSARLEAGLTPEMIKNFDLFLYVSKADAGPLSQRMYIFEKTRSGKLKLLYDWAASTGRERSEISPRGAHTVTDTPAGYYELDPDRMYRSYRSYNWKQDMPDAMFFNWERKGLVTGLAIHAATGRDVAKLGERASAGCVHLAPENAATLFNLIRRNYRGVVPRFAYDAGSQTMSNQGKFMHDRTGRLEMAEGYRVLIRIENYGGDNDIVAALF